jgi:hypothetical protein
MFALVCSAGLLGCNPAPRQISLPPLPDAGPPDDLPPLVCTRDGQRLCVGNKHYTCKAYEEFLETTEDDCSARELLCHPERGCIACSPGDMRCKTCSGDEPNCTEDVVQACNEDGTAWDDVERCDLENQGLVCSQARCQKACDVAKDLRGYVGCEFYAADLDNAALSDMNNASAQQYAVAVANPNRVAVEVRVDLNDAPYGSPVQVKEVERRRVAPGDLEVFRLPRREVDGSSATGLNDGTHTAVTSNAYRITSLLPITAYQFNPLENVNVFSNDASLLYPISALGSTYTIVGWPQTIGDSENPEQDFDSTSDNDDLRVFLTILGTQPETKVNLQLGSKVMRVVGGGPVPTSRAGDSLSIDIGPFDVINLETQGLNADFTGTFVDASHPVAIFVGSEASDVPMFDTYAKRQCCADHLEEQLLPDTSAGTEYVVGRMPVRTEALNAAAAGESLGVSNKEEDEWIRVVALADNTRVQTTLDPPHDDFMLAARGDRTLVADRDVVIRSSGPIQVLQALGSQGVTGIPRQYPGGDPSIIAVPPVQQYRRDYIFLTPDKYLFDFVTITAPRDARIRFDGGDLPESCVTSEIEGFDSNNGMGAVSGGMNGGAIPVSEIEWVVHRCQLAFPEITKGTNPIFRPGIQHDGVHTIVSDREVAIIVYGFDRFVSYAYVGGLDFDVLQ